MVQEIKLKVGMHCQKCRTEVMKAVTKLPGVDEVSVDLEKEMLVVIGDVDPVGVATCLRKKKRVADIVNVGPRKNKESGVVKKDVLEPNHTRVIYPYAPYDTGYQQIVYGYPPYYDVGSCNIV
uniref:heavy metal-associated isoprenylated plant protein 2-like n=1 Tax=Erigeron canadensis TaxID=72917 RepID=UPI001CB9CAE0|nr:heavy metal-associated isoprenylated plant protein 2-like [Erigeron canadensis]